MKATISEKGQVTIPKRLRDRLGLRAGQVLDFEEANGALIARRTHDQDPVDRLFGILDLDVPVDTFVDDLRGAADVS
ncbi:MAG TPA: AbrB/MazE/SpoVT family DNA-binding domain-containing protein [Candidatus Saccharimonadales bacterium]|nr:AbrB/MazE/SpoVT family DNA-binding domain-containing protein [Candidatus Saccharimonadales bacterium]